MVDHVGVGFSCTCPSRRRPCKHALALLMLWVNGQIVETVAPPTVDAWLSSRQPVTRLVSDTTPTPAEPTPTWSTIVSYGSVPLPRHTPHTARSSAPSEPHRLDDTSGRAAVIAAGVGAIASTCSADQRVT
jgi:hypothetical protein